MYARRLGRIAQMPLPERFPVLAEGAELIAENVETLAEDIEALGEKRRYRAVAALRVFAEEEAAKVLIILDIARGGWRDQKVTKSALGSFYSHLSRGLYVQPYGGSPADLAEVRRYVDMWRREFYLDGPMEVDWIFSNDLITGREERLYVDYVEDENGDRRWVSPRQRSEMLDAPFSFPDPPSVVVQLVGSMRRIGLLSVVGLEATRETFEGVVIDDCMHWQDLQPLNIKVLQKLVDAGRITNDAVEDARYVVEHWIFPLTSLDLTLEKVDPAELKQARDAWLARELGLDDFGYY